MSESDMNNSQPDVEICENQENHEICPLDSCNNSSSNVENSVIRDEEKAFSQITEFVQNIWELCDDKNDNSGKIKREWLPTALYHRMFTRAGNNKDVLRQKSIDGFNTFYKQYSNKLILQELHTLNDVCISFGESDTIKLQIHKLYMESDNLCKIAIQKYLLLIYYFLCGDKDALNVLDRLDVQMSNDDIQEFDIRGEGEDDDDEDIGLPVDKSTNEGKFVNGIMKKAKHLAENVSGDDPGKLIMGLMSSGIVGEMINGVQSGTQNGTMNINNLLSTLQGALSTFSTPPSNTSDSQITQTASQTRKRNK